MNGDDIMTKIGRMDVFGPFLLLKLNGCLAGKKKKNKTCSLLKGCEEFKITTASACMVENQWQHITWWFRVPNIVYMFHVRLKSSCTSLIHIFNLWVSQYPLILSLTWNEKISLFFSPSHSQILQYQASPLTKYFHSLLIFKITDSKIVKIDIISFIYLEEFHSNVRSSVSEPTAAPRCRSQRGHQEKCSCYKHWYPIIQVYDLSCF